jgi:hypothetical protein
MKITVVSPGGSLRSPRPLASVRRHQNLQFVVQLHFLRKEILGHHQASNLGPEFHAAIFFTDLRRR